MIKRFDYSVNRKEAISEVTAYTMARMMPGASRYRHSERYAYKSGCSRKWVVKQVLPMIMRMHGLWVTRHSLLAGAWVGFEYNFMRNQGDGSGIARPISEYFFKKVLENKKMGIDKDAKFIKPAEMENEVNSADIITSYTDAPPGAEGDDQGVGTEDDYNYSNDSIGAESKEYKDDEDKVSPKKDTTTTKAPIKKEEDGKPTIGSKVEEPKKKKGLLKKIFGKKDE